MRVNKTELLIWFLLLLGVSKLLNRPSQHLKYYCGYALVVVVTASMEPEYPVYTLVTIENTAFSALETGMVIAYRAQALGGRVALHRIIEIKSAGIVTKGDNNDAPDEQLVTRQTYLGRAVAKTTLLRGYITAINAKNGLFLYLILPIINYLIIREGAIYLIKKRQLSEEEDGEEDSGKHSD